MDARQQKQYRRALDFAEMHLKAARKALRERNAADLQVAEEERGASSRRRRRSDTATSRCSSRWSTPANEPGAASPSPRNPSRRNPAWPCTP